MAELQAGEEILLEGRAGYETQLNRGRLILTDRRLIWERVLSIDPFGGAELIVPLEDVKSCKLEGDVIVVDTGEDKLFLFLEWLPLSILSGGRRSKNWVRGINRAGKRRRSRTA